jgi:hypothetical protein
VAHLRPAWLNDTPIPSPFAPPPPQAQNCMANPSNTLLHMRKPVKARIARSLAFTAPEMWESSHCPGLAASCQGRPCQGAPSAPSGSSCPGQRTLPASCSKRLRVLPARRAIQLAPLYGFCGAPLQRRPRRPCRPAGGRARAGGGGARLAALQVRDVQHLLHVRAAHRALAVVPPQLLRLGSAALRSAASPPTT